MQQRRTFIQNLFATLTAFVAALFGWRKQAQAATPMLPPAPPPPPEPEGFQPTQWDDIFEMTSDIAKHTQATGNKIVCNDDPYRRTIGFMALSVAGRPVAEWNMVLTKLRTSLAAAELEPQLPEPWNDPPGPLPKAVKAQLFRTYLSTTGGREKIAQSFPGQRR